jgi:hypothetical protein
MRKLTIVLIVLVIGLLSARIATINNQAVGDVYWEDIDKNDDGYIDTAYVALTATGGSAFADSARIAGIAYVADSLSGFLAEGVWDSLNTLLGFYNAVKADTTAWNTAYSWGDHSTEGYLTSYTETDPIFDAHVASDITSTNISNWTSAYNWGDHSLEGYLTSYTETDPTVGAHIKSITVGDKNNWTTAYSWGDHSTEGYLTSYTETDPVFDAHVASGITSTNISNWTSAYGWGDHSTEGYITTADLTDGNIPNTITIDYSGDVDTTGDEISEALANRLTATDTIAYADTTDYAHIAGYLKDGQFRHIGDGDDIIVSVLSDSSWVGNSIIMTLDGTDAGTFGRVYYVKSNGKVEYASHNSTDRVPAVYMCVQDQASGNPTEFVRNGIIKSSEFNLTTGNLVYLGENGVITTTKPADSGDVVQILGVALSDNIIEFQPNLMTYTND